MKLPNNLLKDNLIIICNESVKEEILKHANSLYNVIFKTPIEFINDLMGSYSLAARINLSRKTNITPEFSEIKLANTFLVNDIYQNDKVKDLLQIKKEFQDFLEINPLINNLYQKKEVVIINDLIIDDKFYIALEMLKSINDNVKFIDIFDECNDNFQIIKSQNYKDEINLLLQKVTNLINLGVSEDKIIIQMPTNYYPYAQEVFNLSNIDLNFDSLESLSSYEITKNILYDLKDYFELDCYNAFHVILSKYKTENNEILNRIISVFNSYLKSDYNVKDIYNDLQYALKTSKYKPKFLGGIYVGKIQDKFINDDDYVFILGFNQDVFPSVVKNDAYLLDYEREGLGLLTSLKKNREIIKYSLKLLKTIKNLFISYAIYTPEGVKPISSLVYELKMMCNVEIKKENKNKLLYSSKKLAEIELGKLLDLYTKYDLKQDGLASLYYIFKDSNYRKYNNRYTKVSKEFLDKVIKPKLTLSYTAIDKYYRCGFLFYIENILKINRSKNEDSFFTGSLVHKILYEIFKAKEVDNLKSFMENVTQNYLKENEIKLTKKDEFFIYKYYEILTYFFDFLKNHLDNSSFKIFALEKEYNLVIDDEVSLKGFIDKILTFKINDTNYAIVVDYKTGNTDFDLNLVAYGLNMQIMFYFYYLKCCEKVEYKFAGGYLQGIIPSNPFTYDKNKTYLEQLYDHFKLYGYSNADINILNHIEHNLASASKYIKGMRINQDGTLHSFSSKKVLDDVTFFKLLKYTENKIKDAIENIKDGIFPINPKKIGNVDSCVYCQYKDLCFKTNKDYLNLKNYQSYEFLGGEDDSN